MNTCNYTAGSGTPCPGCPKNITALYMCRLLQETLVDCEEEQQPLSNMDKNCLSYWFPLIQAAGLPVPETRIFRTAVNLLPLCDGEPVPEAAGLLGEITEAALAFGGECFLRTGHTSGKHDWRNTCALAVGLPCGLEEARALVTRHVANLVEYSAMASILGLPTNVWVVREYLPVDPLYVCRNYLDMPVVVERRLFVRDGVCMYDNPYWPQGALEEGNPDRPDWRETYIDDHARLAEPELSTVYALAALAGAAVGGDWSVDLLKTRRGWVITDMAVAQDSYGYSAALFDK